MDEEQDVVIGNNFAVTEHDEVDWPDVWANFTLRQKLRWFEFRASVEPSSTTNRQMTYLYAAELAHNSGAKVG